MIWDDRGVIYRVVGWTVALATAAVTIAIVQGEPTEALAGDSALALTAEIAVGLLLVAAASVARSPIGVRGLLAACGVAWLIAEWNSPAAGAAFTAGLVLYAAWPPLLAHAALRQGDRSLSAPAALMLAIAYADSLLVLGAGSALFLDTRAQGCFDCPANWLLVSGHPAVVHDLGRLGLWVAGAWSAGFAALVLARLARATPARRRIELPFLLPATAAIGLFAARALHGAGRGFMSNDRTDRALWVAQLVALALVAGSVVWERVRARRTRNQLAELVVELGRSPPAGGLRDQLAEAFGDPSLELLHALDDDAGWVDGDGRPADIPDDPDRQVTRVLAGGSELSAIVHRPGLFEAPGVAAELADAARVALEHERLGAIRRAHLEGLRASRERIVARADTERRSLERDLHDGAQQRLATLAVTIRLARRQLASRDPKFDPELGSAEEGLREALAELRELAHGLIPAVLAHEGLGPATEALADRSPRLVVGDMPAERFAPQVESAAYFLVAETVRRFGAGDVSVSARREDGRLLVRLETVAGIGGPITDLEDRVGAVGGTLAASRHELRAELPCGS
jgi:signal transduction histidine kinase